MAIRTPPPHRRQTTALPRVQAPDTPSPRFDITLASAKKGDREALNRLFEQFYPEVSRIVHRSLSTDIRHGRSWLVSRFSTGDVVQEVFRSVLKDVKSFQGTTEDSFMGYLAMVVRNRIIDAIRFHEAEQRDGRIPSEVLVADEHVANGQGPSEELIDNEEVEHFHASLDRLPERERLLVRARLEGVASFAELKDQLGYSSVTSTRRAYAEALARLSVWMRPQDEEETEGEVTP